MWECHTALIFSASVTQKNSIFRLASTRNLVEQLIEVTGIAVGTFFLNSRKILSFRLRQENQHPTMAKFSAAVVALLALSGYPVAADEVITDSPTSLPTISPTQAPTAGTDAPTSLPTLSPTEAPILCSGEVQECPDGSFVNRVPPDCEFEE